MANELSQKVNNAVSRIKAFEEIAKHHADDGTQGYYLAFSGGKDSVVVKALLDLAGVEYDAHYNVTSVDPPELVRFIKTTYPDVTFDKPRYSGNYKNEQYRDKQITMWNLIPQKLMPPTRLVRYCCAALKESGGDGRLTVTGVRWAESTNRKNNQGIITIMGSSKDTETPDFRKNIRGGVVLINDNDESRDIVDACVTRHKTCVNPIIDWTDNEVWEFIKTEHIPYCGLYDDGFQRLGCIGCPMASSKFRKLEFARYPRFKAAYLLAFEKMLEQRKLREKKNGWYTARDVYHWWMKDDVLPGQIELSEIEQEGEE